MPVPDPTRPPILPEPFADEALRADPAGAAASPILGVSQAELEEIQANIRWFSALTLDEKLAISRRARAWAREAMRATRGGGDGP